MYRFSVKIQIGAALEILTRCATSSLIVPLVSDGFVHVLHWRMAEHLIKSLHNSNMGEEAAAAPTR